MAFDQVMPKTKVKSSIGDEEITARIKQFKGVTISTLALRFGVDIVDALGWEGPDNIARVEAYWGSGSDLGKIMLKPCFALGNFHMRVSGNGTAQLHVSNLPDGFNLGADLAPMTVPHHEILVDDNRDATALVIQLPRELYRDTDAEIDDAAKAYEDAE